MKKIAVIIVSVIALAGMISFEACQSAKSSTASKMLKFNLESGKGYDYEMTVNMDQEIMGQQMKMDMSTYYSMDVAGDDGSTKTITTAIDRFRMKTAVAGFNVDIDTDKPFVADSSDVMGKSLGALNKVFGAIKGQQFSMKVTAEGKITEVNGFENMGKNIADSLGLDGNDRAEMLKQFEGQFNADEIKQSLERVWYIFPNKEVKVGDSWQKSTAMGGKMPAKYNSTYKVTDIEGDMVTLEETSKIETRENEAEEIKLSGDVTGTIVVDSRTGLVVTADQDMKIKATSKGMSFDIKGKTKIKGKAR
ncbi:MAG TPA: DUF6263 family protein [Chitinophagaceae bacterium]|nr:DUF6263 family protein [Chitinophagaceae bacterium]